MYVIQPPNFQPPSSADVSILGNFIHLQDWTLVDLTFGVVAASLPILSAFIPSSWKSVRGTNDPTSAKVGTSGAINPNGTGGYVRSRRRTSISGKREMSDSMENIVRTDVIELKFQNKSQFLSEGGKDERSRGGGDERDWISDEIFPNNLHNETWVGRGSGRKEHN